MDASLSALFALTADDCDHLCAHVCVKLSQDMTTATTTTTTTTAMTTGWAVSDDDDYENS
ncbi:GH22246 [Drosophila grimshawi]|uniref:GH22246 n=1 Tax=Drosophila grimshawi TaxID=7222 RepID=B4K3Y6_DROGR|nr:GH22246 [Drosophila grimshawi]